MPYTTTNEEIQTSLDTYRLTAEDQYKAASDSVVWISNGEQPSRLNQAIAQLSLSAIAVRASLECSWLHFTQRNFREVFGEKDSSPTPNEKIRKANLIR